MNKIFIVAFLAFLTLGQSYENGRQFVTSFLKASTGKDIKLSSKCLGASFDKSYEKVKKYIKSENITLLLLTVQSMFSEIQKNCPLQDFIDLGNVISKKIQDGSLFKDIDNKLNDAVKLLMKEWKIKPHTPTSIGATSGGIVAVFIREKANFLSFFDEKLGLNALKIAEGVILGLGKDDKSTKCHDDIMKHKDEIIKIIKELIEAIKSGTDIMQALMQAATKLMKMFEIIGDCRIFELVSVVQKIATPEGMAALKERIQAHMPDFIKLAQNLFNAFMKKDDIEMGKPIGEALQIALDFYVN